METIDLRTKSYYNSEGKHLLRGFYIGTKPTQNRGKNWSVSKKTIGEIVKRAIGTDFIVVPDLLKKTPEENHVYSENYDELIEQQKAISKGKITDIFGPFDYEDGTDDIFYDAEVDVTDKPVSEALSAGVLPLSLSPYIFPAKDGKPFNPSLLENREGIEDWVPAHLALVKEGAFGWRAAIGKQCMGAATECHNALAASTEQIVNLISSQIRSEVQNTQMSDANTQNLSGPTGNANEVPKVDNAPVKQTNVPSTPESSTQVSVEAFTKMQTDLAEQTAINKKLVLNHKTDVLGTVFNTVADETEKAKLIKKWIGQADDVDLFAEFHKDILNHVIPAMKIKPIEKKEEKEKISLAASGDSEEAKADKTDFPLAGSSTSGGSRLERELSLTELAGGPL